MAFLRGFFLVAVVGTVVLAAASGGGLAQDDQPRVLAVEFANDVNPVTADYLIDAIERGEEEGYDAVVLLTDTPGGLDTAMRDIIQKELEADVPIVLYVAPQGARAASAGAFLAMAADVAAMSPQTSIGSSTPVDVSGEEIPADLRKKVVNDAASLIRELAAEHGRNADVAEDFVRDADNLGAREALDQDVVDVVADDLTMLLDEIDGMRTEPKGLVLDTAGAEVDRVEMGVWKRVLDLLVDPNLIVLLMSIGLLGITVEIFNPGLVFPGTIGAISLVLGLFGLQVLPVSWAGILLILLALGFFAAEAFVASHGALALAGGVSFIFGALMLFDPAGDAYQVSVWVALAIAGTFALVLGLALAKVVEVRRTRPQTGEEELVGDVAVVRQALDPAGYVFVHGELWRARTEDGPIGVGERVRVERVGDGLVLEVARIEEPEAAPV
ncbi:MAG TPA: nodulation protein NfeD [Gaiellaceae bacterium]|nr:nodulation protein NfeD [Gaiellaceae bacterium]